MLPVSASYMRVLMVKRYIDPFGAFCLLALLLATPLPAGAADVVRTIEFPVNGKSSFRDDFHEPRGADAEREHLGIDIIAAKMTPVVAAVAGTVTNVVSPEASWGYSLSITDSDGYQYRYLHLNNDTPGTDDGKGGEQNAYAPDIRRGARVEKGQLIGWVGDSGNAEAVGSHLHFEIREERRTPVNPYPSLAAAAKTSANASIITVGAVSGITHPSEGNIGVEPVPTTPITVDLAEGASGEPVRQLQTALKALGFFTSYVTDYFGPITRAAVMNFQKANTIAATGIVGAETRAALNGGRITPVEQPSSGSGGSYAFTQTLALNSRGGEVRELQTKLKALGYFTYPSVTDYFGPVTKAAVISFQNAKGIDPIGIVGPKTRAVLNAL